MMRLERTRSITCASAIAARSGATSSVTSVPFAGHDVACDFFQHRAGNTTTGFGERRDGARVEPGEVEQLLEQAAQPLALLGRRSRIKLRCRP